MTFTRSSNERLWVRVEGDLEALGAARWPFEGDRVLARSVWCAARHSQPSSIVETGVARGVTSRVILEALHRNGRGTLWSVDLPPLRDPWFSESRTAVPRELWDGWNYVRGSSQRVLPGVVAEVGQIDIFLHDSLHTYRHMSFELDLAKRSLSPTGVIVADDVNQNQAFAETLQGDRDWDALTARHESKRGAIGVAWRRQAASSGP